MDAVAEPNPTLRSDEAGASAPPLFSLDSVGFGRLTVSLTGEALGEQTRVLLLILTHVWRGNAGSVTDVCKRKLIYCGQKRTLATPHVLIINFYSEYNLFAHG